MIFSVKNGYFDYKAKTSILQDVSFSVKEGDVLAILGPNGVGKTTLLRCMMGLLSWKSGASYIDDVNIKDIPHQKMWQKIAYVPQAKSVAFSYTLEEMVLLGRSAHIGITKQPKKDDLEICHQAMDSVGILHLKDCYCNQVSGGELQMVLIARALCTHPSMLILDEPESNLDFRNQLIILETIHRLAKEQSISCVFNTHYPAHALKIADNSLILARDGTCYYGKTENVMTNEHIEKVFQVKAHINHVKNEEYNYYTVTALSIT